MPINIYITSFFRIDMTVKTINLIHERTNPGTFAIHIYDNGSDAVTKKGLIELLEKGLITSLHLDSRNTGCLYNKGVFYAMTESKDEYFCVSDNDVFPPKLTPDWLSQMVEMMDKHQDLGMLAPQLPPQQLQSPYSSFEDIIYCRALGNTFKLVRTRAYPLNDYNQALNTYGDDGMVSQKMIDNGWKVAFCKNIFCYHAGQCEDWGYTKEQIDMDPRKQGYGKHFEYKLANEETYEPEPRYRL